MVKRPTPGDSHENQERNQPRPLAPGRPRTEHLSATVLDLPKPNEGEHVGLLAPSEKDLQKDPEVLRDRAYVK